MCLKLLTLLSLCGLLASISTGKPCAELKISGADSVCVCNRTYCDDVPALTLPNPGQALVFESGKTGNRFKETVLKLDKKAMTEDSPLTQTITINKSQTYQKIIGFGGAITDETAFVISNVSKGLSDNIMKSYFSKDGIEYNMGRVPVAATDYSFRIYNYDDVDDDKSLAHFALAKEDLEWKIPFIKKAQSLSTASLQLFGSPWLAPKWVKDNDTKINQLKRPIGGEYYQIWSNYLVKFLDAYKAQNASLWGLTIQNEPTLGNTFPATGLYYNSSMMKAMVKQLGQLLHKSGYTSNQFKLMMFDDNVDQMEEWTDTILSDKESEQYVEGIAYHWYKSSRNTNYPDDILDKVHKKYPKQFMLMTEACHLEGLGNGRWDFGEHYAHDIIRDINHWTGGWVEWNIVLALNGCTRCNLKQCGASLLVDIEKDEAYKQPSFYTIGHFSKFLPRNSVRIGHQLGKDIKNLFVLTMKRPDNATVVVVLNQNNSTIGLQISDSDKHLSHSIPERSIQTYVL